MAKKILPASPAPPGEGPREWQLLAALNHPNVVAILDRGQVGSHFYLVTEFVPGQPLRAILVPGEPWPVDRALPVLNAIAQGLEHIHQQGILHLDLKPENVLCTPDGAIKIVDFGLAMPHVFSRPSQPAPALGTIDYCSPEQRHGLPTDPRSDLFSFAVLTYELHGSSAGLRFQDGLPG